MSRYKEFEEKVFNWLMAKHQANPEFTFSIRQKANKGSERDYFIGTERSKYFGTTFWHVPVYFPGSSTDLINLMFFIVENGYRYTIEFQQTRNPEDDQNRLALQLVEALKPKIKTEVDRVHENAPENKMFYFYVEGVKPKYTSVDDLLADVDRDLNIIMPIVDQQIAIIKGANPEFKGGRYSIQAFDKMVSRMQERQRKYSKENIIANANNVKADVIKEQTEIEGKEETIPLNQILYGPPGTGKTFNTINKAVEIANPRFEIDTATRAEIHREYDRLVEEGVIQFCTFHQSMSYEDFVEGIKPDPNKAGKVTYSIQPGIFKKVALAALRSTSQANAETRQEKSFDVLWSGFINHLNETYQDGKYPFVTKEGSELRPDKAELENGRLIAYYRWSNSSTKTEPGKTPFPIKGDKIKWMVDEKIPEDIANLTERLKPVINYHLSPHFAVYKSFLSYAKAQLGESFNITSEEGAATGDDEFAAYLGPLRVLKQKKIDFKKGRPYVLIIDEINRGNVSQVFGELITLLEEDKRFGKKEGLTIQLPYSKKEFAVPDNLYLIGTMNTADRSVEALDTALRRRFVFENMMPNPSLLHPKELILNFWNDERYINVRHKEWMEEPYKSVTDMFYELIGFDRKDEETVPDRGEGDEDILWTEDDLKHIDDNSFDNGIRLDLLLTRINERIEKLLSADQQIGHAFFINTMSVEHLYQVINEKLIPQLQEYFYGDFGKIGLVLGKAFVVAKNNKTLFADFAYEDKELLNERKLYQIHDFRDGGNIDYDSFLTAVKEIYQVK